MEASNAGMISPSLASVVIMTGDGATNSYAPSTSSSTRTARSQIGKRAILDHASEAGKGSMIIGQPLTKRIGMSVPLPLPDLPHLFTV